MRLLTVNLDFEGQKALLVGAGAVGRRKLSTLLEAGATVRVVEPNPAPWLLDLATEGLILLEKAFDPSFLDESPWVFVATNLDQSIMAIVKLAQKKGLWVSLASDPKESNFFQPAVASDEPFRLAVSTGGS
ncbi:MAG: hypothetical protein LBI10_12695, partial [Deltaproteobacteria bacterium]|nr:hypothetical protein [Deltaproteobacteria bacterium]